LAGRRHPGRVGRQRWPGGTEHQRAAPDLLQTRTEPIGALEAFAQLLSRLHDHDPSGIITARIGETAPDGRTSRVEFGFAPFTDTVPATSSGDHTGS
jgi:hypothetical protein